MLAAFESIPRVDRVIVALDCPRAKALDLAVALQGKAKWLKIGMTLYYSEGPAIVEIFKLLGYKVFLDLKCHDIPHQVAGAAGIGRRGGRRHDHHACRGRRSHDGSRAGRCRQRRL